MRYNIADIGERQDELKRATMSVERKTRSANDTVPYPDGSGCVNLRSYPSTRYQGSKRKILPWLWGYLKAFDFDSALDVFGGTGSVSYLLKRMGKEVTYNDHLRFNYLIGLALIENDDCKLGPEDVDFALAATQDPTRHFVQNTFGGIYFTDEENAWIDNVVSNIIRLDDNSSRITYKRALLYYSLFQSCLVKRPFNLFHRRNLYLRFADVKRTFYNKTTWDKPFKDHFIAFCAEANRVVLKGAKPCRAICHDAAAIPEARYDLVYIDPPYLAKRGDRRSSDYENCYHFLEGLANYDSWTSMIDYATPHLRMAQRRPNPWSNRDEQIKAFDAIFEKFAKSIIVVSYKKFGAPSIDTLIRMMKRHGRNVRSHSRHYIYALNHQNGEAKLNREVLLISE